MELNGTKERCHVDVPQLAVTLVVIRKRPRKEQEMALPAFTHTCPNERFPMIHYFDLLNGCVVSSS